MFQEHTGVIRSASLRFSLLYLCAAMARSPFDLVGDSTTCIVAVQSPSQFFSVRCRVPKTKNKMT